MFILFIPKGTVLGMSQNILQEILLKFKNLWQFHLKYWIRFRSMFIQSCIFNDRWTLANRLSSSACLWFICLYDFFFRFLLFSLLEFFERYLNHFLFELYWPIYARLRATWPQNNTLCSFFLPPRNRCNMCQIFLILNRNLIIRFEIVSWNRYKASSTVINIIYSFHFIFIWFRFHCVRWLLFINYRLFTILVTKICLQEIIILSLLSCCLIGTLNSSIAHFIQIAIAFGFLIGWAWCKHWRILAFLNILLWMFFNLFITLISAHRSIKYPIFSFDRFLINFTILLWGLSLWICKLHSISRYLRILNFCLCLNHTFFHLSHAWLLWIWNWAYLRLAKR